MHRHRRFIQLLLLASLFLIVTALDSRPARGQTPRAVEPPLSQAGELTGTLSFVWGDPQPERPDESQLRAFLTVDQGQTLELALDDQLLRQAGGAAALNGRRVTVDLGPLPDQSLNSQALERGTPLFVPQAIRPESQAHETDVFGSQPFVSILCKFRDVLQEQRDRSYFQAMYGATAPGLNHYWQALSYGQMNINGSDAFGWYLLPENRAAYFRADGSLKLGRLFDDCAGAAEADVDFSAVAGINLMFNAELDGFAWGGTIFKMLDGQSRMWRATWEPPWAFENLVVTAHEMGHTFGMPHSNGGYGRNYDNRWDVMSDMWTDCARSTDVIFGCVGQHAIAINKDLAGWLDGRTVTVSGETQTIQLDRLAQPGSGGYLAAYIPIAGNSDHFYSVEARQQIGYDGKLPLNGVIIHEVDLSRNAPAHLIDSDNNKDSGDAGAQWLPGETFSGEAGISVTVDSSSADGSTVTITPSEAVQAPSPQTFYLSTKLGGRVDGLSFKPADIVRYDAVDGLSMLFDGSDVGISKNLAAFAFEENGTVLLALSGAQSVNGLGTVKPQEVFRFVPSSLGDVTAGSFEWVLQRADSELTTSGEKVDALAGKSAVCWSGDAAGGMMVSTNGRAVLNDDAGLKFRAQDEDLMLHDGAWSFYFDGSAVRGLGREDINGLWQDPATCDLYVTILGSFSLGSVKGNGKDIIRLTADVSGDGATAISYTPSLFWDGSAAKFPQNLDAIEFPSASFP